MQRQDGHGPVGQPITSSLDVVALGSPVVTADTLSFELSDVELVDIHPDELVLTGDPHRDGQTVFFEVQNGPASSSRDITHGKGAPWNSGGAFRYSTADQRMYSISW